MNMLVNAYIYHNLRELEALLIRISKPKWNNQTGKFNLAEDLCRTFRKDIMQAQNRERRNLFCENEDIIRRKTKPKNNLKTMEELLPCQST